MRNRKRVAVNKQRNLTYDPTRKKSITKEDGDQLVANKTHKLYRTAKKYITCLPDTLSALLSLETKEVVHSAMVSDMPAEEETSIFHIVNEHSNCGHYLERVSGN